MELVTVDLCKAYIYVCMHDVCARVTAKTIYRNKSITSKAMQYRKDIVRYCHTNARRLRGWS